MAERVLKEPLDVAQSRLEAILQVRPLRRPEHGACPAITGPGGGHHGRGGSYLCWLLAGHDGLHLNPHLRWLQRPAGWFSAYRLPADLGASREQQ